MRTPGVLGAKVRRSRPGPLTICGMATRRTQPTGRRRRPCPRDRPHLSGERDKENAPGGYCYDWVSVKKQGSRARRRGLGDLVRVWLHHGTLLDREHAQVSAGPLTPCGMATRRTQPTGRRGRAGGIGRTSDARTRKRERMAAIPTTGPQWRDVERGVLGPRARARVQQGPLTSCDMATRRTQPTVRRWRSCRRDRAHVRGERDKERARGGYYDDWASVKRHEDGAVWAML